VSQLAVVRPSCPRVRVRVPRAGVPRAGVPRARPFTFPAFATNRARCCSGDRLVVTTSRSWAAGCR